MKIQINVKKFYPKTERLAPFVNLTVYAPKYRIFGATEALIDTGSPSTSISPRDVIKFQIPIKNIAIKNPPITRIAGFKFPRYQLKNVNLKFKTQNNKIFNINNCQIDVYGADISKLSKKDRIALSNIPSIIGSDILEDNNLAIYFNPANKIAYLEK